MNVVCSDDSLLQLTTAPKIPIDLILSTVPLFLLRTVHCHGHVGYTT